VDRFQKSKRKRRRGEKTVAQLKRLFDVLTYYSLYSPGTFEVFFLVTILYLYPVRDSCK